MESAIAHVVESGEQRTSDVAAGSSTFEELHLDRNILKGLQSHKFLTPTKIQAAAIPMAFAGMDLLVQSKSGTGKTLIYVLAALQLLNKKLAKPQVLIIVPTRELAIQVEDTANGLTQSLRDSNFYRAVSYIGGTDVKQDRVRMAKGRIVVGTPGRLLHLVHNQVFNTSSISLLVLDEADQLYATPTLQKDVNSLIKSLRSKCQIIACSATYPNDLDKRLAKLMDKPILVSNSERATVLLGVRQFVYELPEQLNSMQEMMAKLDALRKIFDQLHYEQGILFASSQSRADSFRNYLKRNGVDCDLMSGAMKQCDRMETFQAYRNFKTRTMVATDLMARGVDSSHANLVINLDPPKDLVTYLHRIGRAGRFGSKGIAITFISSPQQCQNFKQIIAEAGTGMSVLQFPQEQQVGFDFWNFESYDFPYFQKMEAHEQEEAELKRIKQRWRGKSEPKQTVQTAMHEEIIQNSAEQVENSSESPPAEVMKIPKASLDEEMIRNTAEQVESSAESPAEVMKIPKASLDEEMIRNNAEQVEDAELKQTIQNVFDQVTAFEESRPAKRAIESTPQTVEEKAVNQIISPLKTPITVLEPQESPIEKLELTPSTDVPAAAPNSINTKTYCLLAPTDRSSTTLLPLGISNTVDDASSIISDSMENDYDSDSSYSSFYSISDARVIWRCALSQRKLQKRRELDKRRPLNLQRWRLPAVKSIVRKVRKTNKKQSRKSIESDEDPDVSTLTLNKNDKQLQKEDNLKTPRPFDFNMNHRLLLICKRFDCVRLLKKFNNLSQLHQLLKTYYTRTNMNLAKFDQLMDRLYDVMLRYYYVDYTKPKVLHKSILPEISNVDNYKKLMKLFNLEPCPYEQIKRELPKLKPLDKLTVHVNQQVNIMPIVVAAPESEEDRNSESSASGLYSGNESEDDDSIEPYSSSGFVESTESASSGIETSQYGSNTSTELDSDDDDDDDDNEEEDEAEEEEDFVNESTEFSDGFSLELTAESDDDTDDTDTEEHDVNADDDDVTLHNADNHSVHNNLALAQERWQLLFERQYQFIANYVDNYMATYQHQY